MLSEILVHLDDGPDASGRAKVARALANAHGAKLRALVVAAAPMAPYGPGSGLLAPAFEQVRAKILDDAERVKRRAESEYGAQVDLVSTHADRVQVDCASVMRTADFTIVAPPILDRSAVDDDVFEAALFLAGRPALVVPRDIEPGEVGRNIVVAWKDCREAARAIHDAAPLLQAAASVRVVAVKGEDDPRHFGQKAIDRMEAAWKGRGAQITHSVVSAGPEGAGAALLQAAAGADLIVMGAYGHWRLSEHLFGGMTKYVFEHAQIPLFMSR